MKKSGGVHYHNYDRGSRHWKFLQAVGIIYHLKGYEVYPTRQKKTRLLAVRINRGETKFGFDSTDVGSTHYIKISKRKELCGPELNIKNFKCDKIQTPEKDKHRYCSIKFENQIKNNHIFQKIYKLDSHN